MVQNFGEWFRIWLSESSKLERIWEFRPWFLFSRFLILEVRTVCHVRVQGIQGLRVATRVAPTIGPPASVTRACARAPANTSGT